jgi:hypothetical protein
MSITATLWRKHWILERNSILLLLGILIVIAIGGLVEVVPLFYLKSTPAISRASGRNSHIGLMPAANLCRFRPPRSIPAIACWCAQASACRPMARSSTAPRTSTKAW